MHKWEYMFYVQEDGDNYTLNGGKFRLQKDQRLESTLNWLGAQGWELVGMSMRSSERYFSAFVLKRPLADS